MRKAALLLISMLVTGVSLPNAAANGEPVVAFEPAPQSRPVYGVTDGPQHRSAVPLDDGKTVMVETWLPQPQGGRIPPPQVPVILIATPYAAFGAELEPKGQRGQVDFFVRRGYAVAIGHLYGTADSDGCWDHGGPREVDATLRMIAFLGTAPWSTGRVGMRGGSYAALSQLAAATSGDEERLAYLKALVPLSPYAGLYDAQAAGDGVPAWQTSLALSSGYVALGTRPKHDPSPGRLAARLGCSPEHASEAAATSADGSFSDYFDERDYHRGAERLTVPTLQFMGFRDETVYPIATIGFWERIPASTPHKLVLGQWGHAEAATNATGRGRADAVDMIQAWFDQYLMGLPAGVESWPDVQVQSSDGTWRAEERWPSTAGGPGQLLLGAGSLGQAQPSGTTAYRETSPGSMPNAAWFVTSPFTSALRISGLPVAELWVRLDRPDAHIAVDLEILGPDGAKLPHPPVFGVRSMQHLLPMVNDYFEQREALPAPYDPLDISRSPVLRVAVRLQPTDLVVPAGGRLRLRVGAVTATTSLPGPPSGLDATVQILHDCEHPSRLVFSLPSPDPVRLAVRAAPSAAVAPADQVDGGGVATASVCGRSAVEPLELTRY